MNYQQVKDVVRQLSGSSPKEVYKVLLEIRKKCPRSTSGVKLFVDFGLVTKLLQIIATSKSFSDETVVRIVDIAVSILSNVCMEDVARKEVLRDTHAIEVFVKLIATVGVERLQVRCCRCIANLTLTPASWEPLHRTPVVKAIVRLLESTGNQECIQTCIRALRLLGQTGSHVDKLLAENAVCAVMKYIDDITTATSSSAVRCIASLTIHRCSPNFASQVISSTKHAHLLVLVSHTDPETSTHALQTLLHLTDNYNYRPVFGNIGGIETFANLLRSEDSVTKPHVLTMRPLILSTLCLCCKEAVNRVKLREHDVLEIFLQSLRNDEYEMLYSRIISALVCFLYDSPSFDILLEKGLVTVLVNHLNAYMDSASVFPIEQLSDSEDDDADSVVVEDECVYTAALNVSKENKEDTDKKALLNTDMQLTIACDQIAIKENNETVELDKESDNVNQLVQLETPVVESSSVDSRCKEVPETSSRVGQSGSQHDIRETSSGECQQGTEVDTATGQGLKQERERNSEAVRYSIDSPTYEAKCVGNWDDYYKGAKCIERFSPPRTAPATPPRPQCYSPLSTSTFYSPSQGSPGYSPQYSPCYSPQTSQFSGYSPVSASSTTVAVNLLKLPHYSGPSSPVYNTASSPVSSAASSPRQTDPSDCYSDVDSESDSHDSRNDVTAHTSRMSEDELVVTDDQTCTKQNDSTNKDICDSINKNDINTGKNFSKRNIFITESETAMNVPYKKLLSSPRGKKRKKIPGPDSVFENNILVLLSCVSQLANPTNYFVTMETIMCLLDYIICMDEPMARAARILSRVFRNPHCFTKLVQLNIPIIVYERLLDKENFNSLRCLLPLKPTCKRRLSTDDDKASVSSESERFSLTDNSFSVEDHQASKRCRISSTFIDSSISKDGKQPMVADVQSIPPSTSTFGASATQSRRQYKGVYHKQGDAVCSPVRCGVAFLEDLSGVADSSFGRGWIERLLYTADEQDKLHVCLCMLFILREIESRRYFLKDLDYCIMLYKILDLLEDPSMRMTWEFQTAVMGLSYLVAASGLPAQLQKLQKEAMEAFMEKVPLNELNADSRKVGNEVGNTGEKSEQQTEGNQEAMEGFILMVPPNELNDGSGNMGNEVTNTKERSEEETSGNQEASAGLSDTPGVSVNDSRYEMEPSVCKIEYLHKDVHDRYNEMTDQVNELETRMSENCRVKQSLLACSENEVMFIVDGKKIPSNRAILSESSEVFSAMLQGHYNEAVLSEIPICDSSAIAFEVIVHYLHNCDCTCRVLADFFYNTGSLESVETCIQVLIESDMYFVRDLKLLAQEMLVGKLLNGESAFIILQYAILHNDTRLQQSAVGMMLTGEGTRQCKVRRFCKVLDSDFCQPFLQLISNICTQ